MDWAKEPLQLVEHLEEIASYSNDSSLQTIFQVAEPDLVVEEYDNWNGGTTHYKFVLRVPTPVFAEFAQQIEQLEAKVFQQIKILMREETHDFIETVLIQPTVAPFGPTKKAKANSKFWIPSFFNLFISHLGKNKISAGNLKSEMENYGISCFVAHEDITPTKEWVEEIENALFSMDALVAILAPGFGNSNWTDHEVGVALGRQVLVIPIMYGRNPYGLIAKIQGLKAKERSVGEVAELLFSAILGSRQSGLRLTSCLVEQFTLSGKSETALAKLKLIHRSTFLTNELVEKIRSKVEQDPSFVGDPELVSQANLLLAKFGTDHVEIRNTSVFTDGDIPF